MNFADRTQAQAREKVCSDVTELTRERYDKAVKQALKEMTDAMSSKGSADVILPIIGLTFAGRIRAILFEEDK